MDGVSGIDLKWNKVDWDGIRWNGCGMRSNAMVWDRIEYRINCNGITWNERTFRDVMNVEWGRIK